MTTEHPKASSTKQRVNLTLETEAIELGEKLAKEERRSLSNLVEVLFEREHERVFGKQDSSAGKEAA